MDTNHSPLVGSAEACRILGDISRATLSRLVGAGDLVPVARSNNSANGAFVFDRSAVEELRARREREALA